jgi:hypothetical protein
MMSRAIGAVLSLALGASRAPAQERAPYYGEGHDYLAKVSPVPTDPAKLAANTAKWMKFRETSPAMTMTPEQLRAVVPAQTGSYKPGCVNCRARGVDRHGVTKAGRWFWPYRFDPLKPHEGTCIKCGMTFPNPKYPAAGKQVFYSPSGVKSEHSYWEDPKTKARCYIDVEIAGKGWEWMEKQALGPLVAAYNDTGDEEYAYRASIFLDEVASKFPAYVWGSNNNKYLKSGRTVNRDGSMGGVVHQKHTDTRIGYRAPTEKMGAGALRATFETFAGTKGMQRLSKELGRDVRKHYMENLLYLTDPGLRDSDPRMSSGKWKQGHPGAPCVGMGLMFARAEYLRWYIVCQEMSGYAEFTFDGGYLEGPGYACLALNPRSNMRMLNGYTDPEGFVVPEGERRYDNWRFPWGRYYADGELEDFWRKAYGIWREISLPDGSPPCFNDSNHDAHGPSADYMDRYTPLEESKPVLKPGMKHVVLGGGEGNDQFQIQMGFGRRIAHGHADTLGIQLYGMGHYLLDDIPYPKHILRAEYSQAWAHNTVTVDKKGQAGSGDGDVIFYAPRFRGLSAVRVDATDAYPDRASVYARTLVAVTTDAKHPYALDVFRIKGGKVHDYMLYSSSFLYPTEVTTTLRGLRKLAGERPLMAEGTEYKIPKSYSDSRHGSGMGDPYGIFTNVRVADAGAGFTLDYRPTKVWTAVEDPRADAKGSLYVHPDGPAVGSLHHVAGRPGMKAMLAAITRKPSPENVEGDMPVMILRSEPADETVFILVHEPYLTKGHITSVKRLPSGPGTIAVEVRMPGRRDTFVMSAGNDAANHEVGSIATDGLFAAVSEVGGRGPQTWLVGGTRLRVGRASLAKDAARYEGTVVKSFRKIDGDAFHGFQIEGDALPPAGEDLRGSSVIVRNRQVGIVREVEKDENERLKAGFTDAVGKFIGVRGRRVERTQPRDSRSGRPVPFPVPERDYMRLTAGAGWALEIHSVSKLDGRTYLVLKDDHGLVVDRDRLRELFQPHRMLDGPTTWRIHTVASSLGVKVVRDPPPFDLRDRVVPGLPADTRAGLAYAMKEEERKPGQEPRLITLSSAVQESFDFFRLPFGKIHDYRGFLRIPADGTYVFHFRPGAKGSLALGGVIVSPERDYRVSGNIVPRRVRVMLTKGYVSIGFVFRGSGGGRYGGKGCGFTFEAPGVPRTLFRGGDFFHTPEQLRAVPD